MADEPANDLFPAPQSEPTRGPWLGLGIGFAIILATVTVLIYSSRTSPDRDRAAPNISNAAQADPYAANVALTDVKMSTAENGLGGVAIYIEGNITNKGDKTLTAATIEVTFKNALNQTVQREPQQVMVILTHEPADDLAALNMAPLKAGASREFRLTFERVSQDWNQQVPELRVTTLMRTCFMLAIVVVSLEHT